MIQFAIPTFVVSRGSANEHITSDTATSHLRVDHILFQSAFCCRYCDLCVSMQDVMITSASVSSASTGCSDGLPVLAVKSDSYILLLSDGLQSLEMIAFATLWCVCVGHLIFWRTQSLSGIYSSRRRIIAFMALFHIFLDHCGLRVNSIPSTAFNLGLKSAGRLV